MERDVVKMKRLALLMIPALILTSCQFCFAQGGLTSQERLDLLSRVESLRNEADAILKILHAEPKLSAAAASPSLIDILTGLKNAIDNINLLVGDARKFLDTTGGTVTQIGNTVDTETKRLSDQMVSNLVTANNQISTLLEEVRGFISTSGKTVGALGSRMDEGMVLIFSEIVQNLDGINDEIIDLISEINDLMKTTEQAVKEIGSGVDVSIRKVGDGVDREIKRISDTIQDSLGQLTLAVTALTSSVTQFVDISGKKMDQIGNRMDTELINMSNQLASSIAALTVQVQALIDASSKFIVEATATLRDIRIAAESIVTTFSDTDGKVSIGIYGGMGGLDTRASVMLWRKPKDGGAFRTLNLGLVDIETAIRPEILVGTMRPPFSIEGGYIEHGIGLRVGYGQIARNGIDGRLQAFSFRDPRVDAEVGYSLRGLRGFLYADDVLHVSREIGGGISFDAGF